MKKDLDSEKEYNWWNSMNHYLNVKYSYLTIINLKAIVLPYSVTLKK